MKQIISRKDALAQGLKFYYTGKPCHNGHDSEREVSDWKCLECRRAKARLKYERLGSAVMGAWRAKKRREDKDYSKSLSAKTQKWVDENREHKKAYLAKYYQDNKEHASINAKEYRAAKLAIPENREKENKRKRDAKKADPESYRSYVRNRRAMLRKAEGRHSPKDIKSILASQNYLCVYCDEDLSSNKYHVDHRIALANGGSNWPSNLQCLCAPCNLAKADKWEGDFLKEMARTKRAT